MDQVETRNETLTLDFESECKDKYVSKAWAKDLSDQIRTAFDKISTAVNTMNAKFDIFSQKFENLEISLRHEIKAASNTAESAIALANENTNAIKELKMEMDSWKQEHKHEIHLLKQEQINQHLETESIKSDNKEIKSECVAIKHQTNNMETYSRRDNLVFPVNETSISCAKAVRKFMVDQLQFNEEDASTVQFVRCHRLNDNRKFQKKPVIVRFKSYSDRETVWSKKSAITNREYSVSEDFPRDIAYRTSRRKLFLVFSKARNLPGIEKKSVSMKADILIINGKRYTVDTLDHLKGQLDMKTFNERANDNRLVFGGIFSNSHPLSNYYLCPIVFRKQKYRSLEHAYQHTKALFFGHAEFASKILVARDSSEAKRIS